jgi:hypothetical protein
LGNSVEVDCASAGAALGSEAVADSDQELHIDDTPDGHRRVLAVLTQLTG